MKRVLRYAIAVVLAIPIVGSALVLGIVLRLSLGIAGLCELLFDRVVDPCAHWIDLHVL